MNDFLVSDHAALQTLLGELSAALDTGDLKLSYARLDQFWARLGVHIRAEHLQLFPAILRALGGTRRVEAVNAPSLSHAQKVIEELRGDHNFFMHELARAIASMRDLMANDQ